MNIRRYILFILMFVSTAAASIQVVNRTEQLEDELRTLSKMTGTYVSVNDLARILSTHLYKNEEREKIVLYIGDHRIKISAESGYVIVDGTVFQMPVSAIKKSDDIFLPAEAFFAILRSTALPGIHYDSYKQILEFQLTRFNINSLAIDEKANGTILRIKTSKFFNEGDISVFKHQNGWFYVTINGGLVDAAELQRTETRGVVQLVTYDQMDESVQLALKLRSDIEGYEFYQSHDPNEIVVTLRSPLSKSAARINSVKNRWRMDTVILDAGHGGKDGGTVGKYGTKEKDITLDITKRVGMMLEKNTRTKVVYTRDEDVFIPLWKRTKIANENDGKLFVSIHVNANPNRNVKGYETYLLRPGKTDDAIEVSSRENAVISLEKTGKKKYESLTGENLIMATMAQAMFMKESEDFAAIVQSELSKKITSKNRGVKQAGFYVLIGASMPNVLVEVGFLSNPSEERKLKKAAYRQQVAEGIYKAIVQFKKSREKVLAEG